MTKKKNSTKELIGIRHFSRNGIVKTDGTELIYFLIQPSNLSVLSDASIHAKISALIRLLSV